MVTHMIATRTMPDRQGSSNPSTVDRLCGEMTESPYPVGIGPAVPAEHDRDKKEVVNRPIIT